jgi:integrase
MALGKVTKRVVEGLDRGALLWDTEVKGFGARRQLGDVFYLLRYRISGKQRIMSIGRHGSPWTPDTARTEARRLLGDVAKGFDPLAERNALPPLTPATMGAEIARYLAQRQPHMKPRAYEEIERHLTKHVAPLHRRRLAEVDRRAIASFLGEIETASGPVARNRVRSSLSAFWNWAIREGLADINPVAGTGKAPETTRERVLTASELGTIWHGLGEGQFADIVRLLMLTGQRREEIGGLRWSEINADAIVLPPERTKNRRAHTIPLSPQARAILENQPRSKRPYVFGIGVAGFSGWSGAKGMLDQRLGLPEWHLHDLRRSAATGMAELAVAPHVIEAVLNHVSGHKAGVAGIYNRATYATECRAALERWADYIIKVVG